MSPSILYSRDDKGVGVAIDTLLTKIQPHFPLTMGKIKPKCVFRLFSSSCHRISKNINFKRYLQRNFILSLPARLAENCSPNLCHIQCVLLSFYHGHHSANSWAHMWAYTIRASGHKSTKFARNFTLPY